MTEVNNDEPIVVGLKSAIELMRNEKLDLQIELWREKRNQASNRVDYFELQRALPQELRYAHCPQGAKDAEEFWNKMMSKPSSPPPIKYKFNIGQEVRITDKELNGEVGTITDRWEGNSCRQFQLTYEVQTENRGTVHVLEQHLTAICKFGE